MPITMDNENNAAADTEYYLNAYLHDIEFPPFEELEAEHVAGERLQNLLENVGHWLASTPLKTRQNDKLWLGRKSKADHFQRMKDSLEEKFPDHVLFDDDGDSDGDDSDWFSDMKRSFKNECDRHPIKNNDIVASTLEKPSGPTTDKPVATSEDDQNYNILQSQQSQLRSLSQKHQILAQLNQQTLDLGTKLQKFSVVFGDKFNNNNNNRGSHSENEEAIFEMYRESSKTKRAQIDQLRTENHRLKRMLDTMISPSPSVLGQAADLDEEDDGSTANAADGDVDLGGTKKRKHSVTMGIHYGGVFIPTDTAWSIPKNFTLIELINMWMLGDTKNRIPPLRFVANGCIRLRKNKNTFSMMKALMTQIEILGREENVWLTGKDEDWNASSVASLWRGVQHRLSPYTVSRSAQVKGAACKRSLEGTFSWRTCYNRMTASGVLRGNRRGHCDDADGHLV